MSLESPEIAFSMDASRVWPPGRSVRPSKVWLDVARPASAEKLPTKVPWYVVLSSASEKRSMETEGEQAWFSWALAGPAAARLVAAARAAVTVASTVLRRMGVTVGRVGDERETGRNQLA